MTPANDIFTRESLLKQGYGLNVIELVERHSKLQDLNRELDKRDLERKERLSRKVSNDHE